MGYRIKHPNQIEHEIKRIALEQVRKGIEELEDAELSDPDKIHQIRKRCKKLRGLVRLLRDRHAEIYQQENDWFRETARPLSEVRDAKVLLDSYDAVVEHFGDQLNGDALASIHQRLSDDRQRLLSDQINIPKRLEEAKGRFAAAKDRIDAWKLDLGTFEELPGYGRTYGRARKAMQEAAEQPTPEAYHEWRKRVKYHWYHTRLLHVVWPDVMEGRQQSLSQLSDWLGLDHDLAVLASTIEEAPEAYGSAREVDVFLATLQTWRQDLERQSQRLGRLLFAEPRKPHTDRIGRYWTARREDGPLA